MNENASLKNKLNELEMDLKEHQLVIEELKKHNPEKKTHKLLDGILIERNVSKSIEEINLSIEKISLLIDKTKEQIKIK